MADMIVEVAHLAVAAAAPGPSPTPAPEETTQQRKERITFFRNLGKRSRDRPIADLPPPPGLPPREATLPAYWLSKHDSSQRWDPRAAPGGPAERLVQRVCNCTFQRGLYRPKTRIPRQKIEHVSEEESRGVPSERPVDRARYSIALSSPERPSLSVQLYRPSGGRKRPRLAKEDDE